MQGSWAETVVHVIRKNAMIFRNETVPVRAAMWLTFLDTRPTNRMYRVSSYFTVHSKPEFREKMDYPTIGSGRQHDSGRDRRASPLFDDGGSRRRSALTSEERRLDDLERGGRLFGLGRHHAEDTIIFQEVWSCVRAGRQFLG
jgi:hypothetical protein